MVPLLSAQKVLIKTVKAAARRSAGNDHLSIEFYHGVPADVNWYIQQKRVAMLRAALSCSGRELQF